MAEETTPPVGATTETTTVPPVTPPGTPPGDNPTIQQMRAQIEAANKAKRDAEAALQELQRTQMTETERLRAEAEDGKKHAAEATSLRTQLESMDARNREIYEAELATIPEEKRLTAAGLSQAGNYADRLASLRHVKDLIGQTPLGPLVGGTRTQPTGVVPPSPEPAQQKPLTPAELQQRSWTDAAKQHANNAPPAPLPAGMEAMIAKLVDERLAAKK